MNVLSDKRLQTERLDQQRTRWVTAGDLPYLLGGILLWILARAPTIWQTFAIDRLSGMLAASLYTLRLPPVAILAQNLALITGPDGDRRPAIRQLLKLIVWNTLTLNTLPFYPPEQLAQLVPLEGESHLYTSHQRKRPTLIWAFHFGVHPLIVAALLRARGYPVHAVTHLHQLPPGASRIRQAYLRQLRPVGDRLSVIAPHGQSPDRKLLDVLRAGECLYVTPDYMLPPAEAQNAPFIAALDFFDHRIALELGSLRLAKRFQATALTILTVWLPGQRPRLVIEPLAFSTPDLTPQALTRDLQACLSRFETYVRAAPHLWWDLKRPDFAARLQGETKI